MAFFSRKKSNVVSPRVAVAEDTAHVNFMGGRSWDISNPLVRLRVAASSCFFGEPMYYLDAEDSAQKSAKVPVADRLSPTQRAYLRSTLNAIDPQDWRGLSPAELLERTIDEALDVDPEATLREAARLRNEEHMRTTPQVILVRAARHPKVRGTGLISAWADKIIKRMDEPAVGMAYQMYRFGKPIPNALKRVWAKSLSKAEEHSLAKYRMENRAVKTCDVMNMVHPKDTNGALSKLAKGELTATGRTWEAVLSQRGSSKEAWLEALPLMGHMALLRNLRNLLQAKVKTDYFLENLVSGARTGQQLPFRYYSAWTAVKELATPEVRKAIDDCLEVTLSNLPYFPGKVASLCDNSGSAQGTTTSSMGSVKVSTIANLTGLLAGVCADEGWLGIFGDRLQMQRVDKQKSILAELELLEMCAGSIGQGTENGLWIFWDEAIRQRKHWDHVFVFSDMQAGHGGLYGTKPADYKEFQWMGSSYIDVPKLISTYRKKVNPSVQVYLVQVAGYQDSLVPEFYDGTYILGGWGEGLLRFAAEMSALRSQDAA